MPNKTKRTQLSLPSISAALQERLRTAAGANHSVSAARIAPIIALRPTGQNGTQYELLVYGDIGESFWGDSVLASDVVKQLNELPPTVSQINVRINSAGGSVGDGFAIYNALTRMTATKVVTVDGMAMSIASLIAMAGDTVEMSETSLLMIHGPGGLAFGFADDHREFADVLDTYASAMASAYVAKSGQTTEQILALLKDRKDHTFTGAEAKSAGFCDVLIGAEEPATDETTQTAAADFLASMERFTARSPAMLGAVTAALRNSHLYKSAGVSASAQPAPVAPSGETVMPASTAAAAPVTAASATPAAAPAPAAVVAAPAQPTHAEVLAQAQATLKTRNDSIIAALKPMLSIKAIAELQTQALSDPSMTVDQVNTKALAVMAAHASPNGTDAAGTVRIEAGTDQREKTRVQAVNFLLIRAGAQGMKREEIAAARQGNPFNGMTMLEMARACLVNAGVNPAGWSKERIVASAITHSDSDFPNIFENLLHKTLINSYLSVEQTWRAFCSTTTLSDYRAHNRYYMGGFSDLATVDQNGEFQDGTFSDAEKETITGKRKGRILNLSHEMIVNDDMGVFTTAAQKLGQAAGRTLEKDVYALFALNTNTGPTMNDTNPLFHSSHNNISGTAAVVGTASFDDMRVGMGSQLDPSGNDYVGVAPQIWVGPLKYKGDADVTNQSRYDVTVSSKFEIPNKVNGMLKTVIGTPRLTGTAWYGFADPNIEPVYEVGFLDGVQEPQVAMEESFRSSGVAWRVLFDYGVAAVGFRGAWKNAGA